MTIFTITTIIVGLAIVVAGIYLAGSHLIGLHIYTEVEINASLEDVYAVLADLANYPDWNPYHVEVTGIPAVGEPLVVYVHKPNGDTPVVHPHMLRMEAGRELTWGGGVRGIFYGEHVFLLEETATGGTHLVHKEDFMGIAVPFVPLDAIEEGYTLMNKTLKDYIESHTN